MEKEVKIPKNAMDSSTVMTVSMPLWLSLKLSLDAKAMGLSRSALIAKVLQAYLGSTKPVIFDGESQDMAPGELERLADSTLDKSATSEHEKTMSGLLPPPESDPDL